MLATYIISMILSIDDRYELFSSTYTSTKWASENHLNQFMKKAKCLIVNPAINILGKNIN